MLLFKLFNKVATWELLTQTLGELCAETFCVEQYDQVLSDAFERGERIYSAAYIMPAAMTGIPRKHLTHLRLLQLMVEDRLAMRLQECRSMKDAFELLRSYPGIGPFLAYQLITDLNYSSVLSFSEMDFVVAGPGAASGIAKCFEDPGDYDSAELIRFVTDRQEEEFRRRDLRFDDLWGRPLQLIDCQNLFCEVDKYARVMHPDVRGIGTRSRIKQRFTAAADPVDVWFPPKWGLNDKLPMAARVSPGTRSSGPEGRRQSVPALAL